MMQLGYYGKTPHRGDFVRFNLPQTFVNIWDDWLQTAIAQAQSTLQSDWPAVYDNAPVYRFVLSEGIAGSSAWAGCMSAQRDKVGRRFPFCFALSLPDDTAPASVTVTMESWFQQIEALCTQVHQKDYAFDELQHTLESMSAQLGQQETTTQPLIDSPLDANPDELLITLSSANALSRAENTLSLLSCVLDKTVGEYSLWMTNGEQASTVLSAGLPSESAATALFSNRWEGCSAIRLAAVTSASLYNEMDSASDLPSHDNAHSTLDLLSADDTQPIPANAARDVHHGNQTDADKLTRPAEPQAATNEALDRDADQEAPSADDWAALADFESGDAAEESIVPTVEPLELDEDSTEDAPWET